MGMKKRLHSQGLRTPLYKKGILSFLVGCSLGLLCLTEKGFSKENEPYNWSGFYVGVSVGYAGGLGGFSNVFQNGGVGAPGPLADAADDDFYTSGSGFFQFQGIEEVWSYIHISSTNFDFGNSTGSHPYYPTLQGTGIFGEGGGVQSLEGHGGENSSFALSFKVGFDRQFDDVLGDQPIVLGVFADYTLMRNRDTYTLYTSGTGGYTGANRIPYIDFFTTDNFWETAEETLDSDLFTNFSSTYQYSGVLNISSSVRDLITLQGKIGFPIGEDRRFLIFVSGGLAIAHTSFETFASLTESLTKTATSSIGTPPGNGGNLEDNFSETFSETTTWYGSRSGTRYGYAVGGGFSYILSDKDDDTMVVWTTDGFYYDFGRQRLTAFSSTSDATYSVSRRFHGFVIRTGIEIRF